MAYKYVTLLEVAKARGLEGIGDAYNGADFAKVNIPIMGGCEICHATVACYNASPSKSGFIRCADGCIGDEGFETTEEFEQFEEEEEGYHD